MSRNQASVGTVEELHARAAAVTGLNDFGATDYLEGMRVLLGSFDLEAGLTQVGQEVARETVQRALVGRLLSESGFAEYPEHADVPIERPIFVTGLPRTGTTALHRLLGADPGNQGVEMWLAERPQPRPTPHTWPDNTDFQQVQANYAAQNQANPEMMATHYMDAMEVEECWRLLQQSMLSLSFESIHHVPTYSGWLAEQDWTDAYRRHKRNLQLIGLNDSDRRWVLKNPSHVFAIDEILRVYPDALIIQTHRDPRSVIGSVCSLTELAGRGWSTSFDAATIGRTQLELWSRGMATFSAARRKADPAQFFDVEYEDLVRDPVGTVEKVYSHFGLPFSERTREAVAAVHEQSMSGARRPSHRYALADFGLSESEVVAKFADIEHV
ncbi:sulfotransferase family protein [Nocardia carnea]|uniref:sulfotransferase family protein n=1 Tax=Nocardia carnea TaxID=37328 RepID=UPI0024558D2F|nr:sulfotransferase [Nocardia carnea]